MKITISGSLYEKCEDSSHNMWVNTKKGKYGSGIINSNNDPRKVERTGRLGECALGSLLNKNVDWEYRVGGDGGVDFKIGEFSCDIKTASYNPKSKKRIGRSLIKYIDGKRGKLHLKSEIYVSAEIIFENRDNKVAEIEIHGWCCRSELKNMPTEAGIYGYEKNVKGWRNYLLMENRLHRIEDLKQLNECLRKRG